MEAVILLFGEGSQDEAAWVFLGVWFRSRPTEWGCHAQDGWTLDIPVHAGMIDRGRRGSESVKDMAGAEVDTAPMC